MPTGPEHYAKAQRFASYAVEPNATEAERAADRELALIHAISARVVAVVESTEAPSDPERPYVIEGYVPRQRKDSTA